MLDAEETESTNLDDHNHSKQKKNLLTLLLGAIGIVYGDIGTSPIYAFSTALHIGAPDGVTVALDILGILSLIFWALLLIVTVKYILFVLRADNKGEGGVLSLIALVRSTSTTPALWLTITGIIGAALFFGDAVITPAVSVLSAVEGLNTLAPAFSKFVVPVTFVILLLLFSVQKFGTEKVSHVFGPITLVWFLVLGFWGIYNIWQYPSVLWSIMPWYAAEYVIFHPFTSLAAIGAVFLAVTGAEAIYADLGHFGRRPIVLAWLIVVFPCLLLNYMGQGAFVLASPDFVAHPFFEMLPSWALVPMIILATLATVVASQAIITGAFSMASQAVQLNLLPRFTIKHTSAEHLGQIYMPRVNFLLAVVVLILVAVFGESSKLAAAYGITVTGNMVVTSILLSVVMIKVWKWRYMLVIPIILLFLSIDLIFFGANLTKLHEGGWVSLVIAAILVSVMWIWIRGSRSLARKTYSSEVPLEFIIDQVNKRPPVIISGTAVFLTGDPRAAPNALLHGLKHYKVLHEMNVIVNVVTSTSPRVSRADRVRLSQFSERFMLVTLTFGYMEQPNVPRALAICRKLGWPFDILKTSFFVSRRSVKPRSTSSLAILRDKIFIFLSDSSSDATEYFQIPTGRVVEVGAQITL